MFPVVVGGSEGLVASLGVAIVADEPVRLVLLEVFIAVCVA